jgi:HSP20 family protein
MANLIRRDNQEVARNRTQDYAPDPLRNWEPFRLMDAMLRWDPFRELGRGWAPLNEAFVPRFDLKETKDSYLLRADLPGVRESDVDISVTGNVLTVSGKREDEHTDEGDHYHASERSYGQFTRSFSLPDGADTESMKADLKDGVLTLHLAKKPEVQARRIAIGSGSSHKA